MINQFIFAAMEEYVRNPSRKLQSVAPGLVKMVYPFMGVIKEDLAWKMPDELADGVFLPNDLLCYDEWLRSTMKARLYGSVRVGEAFMGSKARDSYIDRVEGRTVHFNDSFLTTNNSNLCDMLVSANSPLFYQTISGLNIVLTNAGFPVNTASWEDYKTWKREKLATF